jgi:hypothetical protein
MHACEFLGYGRLSTFNDKYGQITINGGTWQAGFNVPLGKLQTQDVAHQKALNYTGGFVLGPSRFNPSNVWTAHANQLIGSFLLGTDVTAQPGIGIFDDVINGWYTGNRKNMHQFAFKAGDSQHRQWRITMQENAVFDASVTFSSYSITNDILSFTNFPNQTSGYIWLIEVGDIFYHVNTGTVFIITSVTVSGTNASGQAQQQNNLRVSSEGAATYVSNMLTDTTLSGYTELVKCGMMLPWQIEYGTFTSGNTSVTNVNRGDGNGTDIGNYYSVGDRLVGPAWANASNSKQYPISNFGCKITAITNGVSGGSGTITLDQPAQVSGSFPIYPYELT